MPGSGGVGGDGPVRSAQEVGQLPADAGLRPVPGPPSQPDLEVGQPPAVRGWRCQGSEHRVPVRERGGQLDLASVDAHERSHAVGMPDGQFERHVRAPRLTHHHGTFEVHGVGDGDQVIGQRGEVEAVVHLARQAVAALVDRHDPVSTRGQFGGHPAPQLGIGREAVDQQEGASTRRGLERIGHDRVQVHVADLDEDGGGDVRQRGPHGCFEGWIAREPMPGRPSAVPAATLPRPVGRLV